MIPKPTEFDDYINELFASETEVKQHEIGEMECWDDDDEH